MTQDPLETYTRLEPVGPGKAIARLDQSWWSYNGPHGGYLAAILLRAILGAEEESRLIRSFCIHFTAALNAGPVGIETRTEWRRAMMTVATARAEQEGRLGAVAIASLGATRGSSFESLDAAMPPVPPPEQCPSVLELAPAVSQVMSATAPFTRHLEIRPAAGPLPFSGSGRGELTAWVRLPGRPAADPIVLTMLSDAIFAGISATLTQPLPVPTLDLTIHYAANIVMREAQRDNEWVLVVNRNWLTSHGYAYEDGELWRPDGLLFVRSRQLRRLSMRRTAQPGADS